MRLLKQSSTAQALTFLMVDSTDHITGKTGLSPTVTIRKAGGSFGAPAGSVTEIANGWYSVAGNATDTNTLGPLILHATGTAADPTDREFEIVAFDPQVAYSVHTAAQAATAVWQDTTAGDFTVASSIGKSLYIANIAPGAAGGHFIAGSNAATTVASLTVTGAFTVGSAIGFAGATAAEVWVYATRTLTDGSIRVASPRQVGRLTLVRGESYYNADSNAITITKGTEYTWPSDLFSASAPAWVVKLYAEPTAETLAMGAAAVLPTATGTVVSATVVRFDVASADTDNVALGRGNAAYRYTVVATRATTPTKEVVLELGSVDVLDDIATA